MIICPSCRLLTIFIPSALKKSKIMIRVALRSCMAWKWRLVNCENLSHNTTSYFETGNT